MFSLFILAIWAVASAAPYSKCSLYLEKLGRIDEIEAHLARHRARVREFCKDELVPIDHAHRTSRLKEAILRRNRTDFFDWIDTFGNGAEIFHGSGSASLMAFMPERNLGLLPNHVLTLDLGVVPLTGWCDSVSEKPTELNNIGMNVVRSAEFDQTETYADGWGRYSREANLDRLRDGYLPNEHTRNIYRTRLEMLADVPNDLRWIVERSFPVVYGFALREDALLWLPLPNGPHTIVASNLSPQELRIVFVPTNKIERVRRIFDRLKLKHEISVVPLSAIAAACRATFSGGLQNFDRSVYPEFYGTDAEFERLIAGLNNRRRGRP